MRVIYYHQKRLSFFHSLETAVDVSQVLSDPIMMSSSLMPERQANARGKQNVRDVDVSHKRGFHREQLLSPA